MMPGSAPAAGDAGMFVPAATVGTVLCCMCGVAMQPNPANMCARCLRARVDITEGVPRHAAVVYCPDCSSYLQPPRSWLRAGPESPELMQILLRRINRPLARLRVSLSGAEFVFSEPHSKRLRLKLRLRREVLHGVVLEQTHPVEFVVHDRLCDSCSRAQANPDKVGRCRPAPPARPAPPHLPLPRAAPHQARPGLPRDSRRSESGGSGWRRSMFTNAQRQVERTGRYGTPREQYLQDLVTQFQNATDEESKEKIAANLANFAYDPFNYAFMRQLNVLELFLDCITEPNERLVEFGIGGICNSCVDPANASVIIQCGGIPLVIQCLSSPVRNTVTYALGALYYLCNPSTKKDILKPDIIRTIREYAAVGSVNISFSNLANAFLEKHVDS